MGSKVFLRSLRTGWVVVPGTVAMVIQIWCDSEFAEIICLFTRESMENGEKHIVAKEIEPQSEHQPAESTSQHHVSGDSVVSKLSLVDGVTDVTIEQSQNYSRNFLFQKFS